jgi:acetyltransferase-like isoleucine patch superfamily enzyme
MFHILFKLINKWYFREKISSCVRQVAIGKNSRFYPEAEVYNLQKRRDKIVIGDNTHIRGELLVWPYGNGINIGDNSYIGKNTVIRAGEKISIGNNVLIAHNVTIIDSDSHELNHIERAEGFKRMLKEGHPLSKGNYRSGKRCYKRSSTIYAICRKSRKIYSKYK